MIVLQLLAAAVTAAPAPLPSNAHQIIVGAEHAVRVNRLEQASAMAARALAAGGSGRDMDVLLADLALAKGKYAEALARFSALLKDEPANAEFLEHAGIAALKVGRHEDAWRFLSAATASKGATWRSWNALGVTADLKRDWNQADTSYARAMQLAPSEFEPINNQGWSLVLRGKWSAALPFFEKAVALEPKSPRARDNLDLVKAALSPALPVRRPSETEASWAARLNDAGVAAAALGDKGRANAAFTRALEVSGTWYARAANNMKAFSDQ